MSPTDKSIIEECTEKLDLATAQSYDKLEHYFLGTQPLAFLAPETRERVGKRLTPLHIDWPRLVLRAHCERIKVEDFRLANQESFEPAYELWQRNNMHEQAATGHLDALLYGRSFVSVWAKGKKSTMRCESAKQVWLEHDPATREVRYGVKRWFDKDRGYLLVLTPDAVVKYRTTGKRDAGMDITNLPADSWETVPGGKIVNRTGRVPFFPLVNRGRILNPHGESLLTEILPIADAINKLATDMMVSAEAHAEPRRWATGVEVIEEDGVEKDAFSTLKGRTWTAEAPDARIGSLPEADLSNFIGGLDMLTKFLLALGSLPAHYADAAKGSLASADSIRAAEASLVAEVRTEETSFEVTWTDAMRYALELEGMKMTPEIEAMELRWRDPENRTQAQIVDAAIKRQSVGVPTLQLWEDMGYTKAQITRMTAMKSKEDDENARAEAAALAAQPTPEPAAPGTKPAVRPAA